MRKLHRAKAVSLALILAASCGAQPASLASAAEDVKIQDRIPAATRSAPPVPTENRSRSFMQLRARLEYHDQIVALRALHMALSRVPDGGTFVWRKKSRSLKGFIQPTKAFRNAEGQVCRHLIYALTLGRYIKQIEGIACRQDDGRWRL